MCLLALCWQQHPEFPLLLVANRDEVHQRATLGAHIWPTRPQLIGGQDLVAGGSWLLTNQEGRWATLTNIREPHHPQPTHPLSRGQLVVQAMSSDPAAFAEQLPQNRHLYAGFNLLWGDQHQAWYFNNRQALEPQLLEPGVHLLSNAFLNTPWPKTQRLQARVYNWLASKATTTDALFNALADTTQAPDQDLPNTGVSLEWERFLSSIFIRGATYGTRSSSLVWQTRQGEMSLWERSFNPEGQVNAEQKLQWTLSHA